MYDLGSSTNFTYCEHWISYNCRLIYSVNLNDFQIIILFILFLRSLLALYRSYHD